MSARRVKIGFARPIAWGTRIRRFMWGTLALLLIILVLAAGAAAWRPAWYRPAAVDYGRLLEDKQALAALESRISAALNAGLPVRIELQEDDVNRWLAARRELWVESPLDDAGLHHPCLRLRPGAVEMGAMLGSHSGSGSSSAARRVPRCVVSGRVSTVVGTDSIELHLRGVAIGALPVPLRLLEPRLRSLVRYDWGDLDPEPSGGLRFRNAFTWPNGRCRFSVGELTFTDGRLSIELRPVGLRGPGA